MIELSGVVARGPAEPGRPRPVLAGVSFRTERGVLAVLGAHKDGATLLCDVIDGTARVRAGRVAVHDRVPDDVRGRIARVSLDAPLPDSLRVEEVCHLWAELRAEASDAAPKKLDALGAANLASRRVVSLSFEERRTVALALALGSKADVLLVEEPLVGLEPVALSRVVDAVRAKGTEATVIVTTASARDAARLGDRLGLLTAGVYTPLPPDLARVDSRGKASVRLVLSATQGAVGAAALAAALSQEEGVEVAETSIVPHGARTEAEAPRRDAVTLFARGQDLRSLAAAVTRAVGRTRIDVELIEPSVLPLDALRAALAAPTARGTEGGVS
jgi:ABC-type multidrug transport system ATPase subunit